MFGCLYALQRSSFSNFLTALLRESSHIIQLTHLKCINQWFFSIVNCRIFHKYLEYFHDLIKKLHAHHLALLSPYPSSPKPPLILFSVSINMPILSISYK